MEDHFREFGFTLGRSMWLIKWLANSEAVSNPHSNSAFAHSDNTNWPNQEAVGFCTF